MKKHALSLAVCIAGAYPLSAGAIGLGDIRSNSHLNQPLSAKIELLSTSTQEANKVQVRLASADVFNRVGIDRPAYLNSLQFTPTVQGGKPVILVSSSQPIKEPFLNFLLEVSWPKGQLLKEYTVLLDPPVLLQSGNTSSGNTAAVRAEPKATGFVKRPKQQALRQQQTRHQEQVKVRDGIKLNHEPEHATQQTAPSTSSKRKYRVNSGDTLYKIATRVKPRGVSADQMMVALFRANPDAFRKNNINRLKAGETLRIPSAAKSKEISTSRAKRVIRKHYTAWKQYRKKLAGKTVPQKQVKASSNQHKKRTSARKNASNKTSNKGGKAHLEVMGNKSNAGAKSSKKVSAAGQARITELEKQLSLAQEALVSKRRENANLKSRISDMESIIQKKDRLISLKSSQLAKLQQSLAAGKTNIGNKATPATSSPVNTDLSAHIANAKNQEAGKISRTQPTSQSAPITAPTAGKTPSTPQARQNDLTPATLAAKRREAAMDDKANREENTPENTGFKPEKENALLSLLSSPIVTAAGAGSILLLLLGWLLLSRRKNKSSTGDDSALASSDEVLIDDDFTSLEDDIAVGTDTVGAIDSSADDDFFKDFGDELDASESDSVVDEIPDTNDVSTAMDMEEDDDILQEADVYIVYGLHEQAEAELRKAINDNPSKLEYRLKLLENYLASNNKEAFDTQAAEIEKIDGNNKPVIWEKVVEMGRKISPDNVLYQVTDSSKVSSSGATAATVAAGVTAATAVAAAAMSSDSASNEVDTAEVSDDENIDLDDLLLDVDSDEQLEPESVSDEQQASEATVAEMSTTDFDDLDDDFSDFGLDDESFSLDELEKELDGQSTDLSKDAEQSNVIDFESMLLEEGQEDSDSTGDDLALANLNLNVDDSTGIDRILPQDTAYTAQGNLAAVSGNEEDDVLSFLDLPEEDIDLHEAHISTKLDLARAYLDMGDVEGARSTLEEVIVEGSDDQKREAEDLLHQTG